jgi:hypothetical protein
MSHVNANSARFGAGELTAGPIVRTALAVGMIAFLLVDGILLANAVRVIDVSRAAIASPFELDFGEGPVLAATRALIAGQSIYPPAQDGAALISNYTPLYYAVAGALGVAVGDQLAAGRALSLLSALLSAAVLAALAWRALGPSTATPLRALAAAGAGLGFLQVSYTASWAALMRVDLLAVFLAFAGLFVFSVTAARGRAVYWCLVPFALAACTKQTALAAALSCIVTMMRLNRRRGVALGAMFAAALVLIATALQVATRGGFSFHVIGGNLHAFRWQQAASFLQDVAIRYPVLVALAVATAPALFGSLPHGRAGGPRRAASAGDCTRAALGTYLALAALSSLSVGKLGGEVNHLIELLAIVCVCAAVAVGEALATARRPATAAAAVAMLALMGWQVVWLAPPQSIEMPEVPPASEQAQRAALLDVVRRVDGPVLSEDLTLLTLADKPIVFQPFDGAQLIARGARDAAPLVGGLERGEFRLVVLRFDVRTPPTQAFDRFPRAAIEAIRTGYRSLGSHAGYWLYSQ